LHFPTFPLNKEFKAYGHKPRYLLVNDENEIEKIKKKEKAVSRQKSRGFDFPK